MKDIRKQNGGEQTLKTQDPPQKHIKMGLKLYFNPKWRRVWEDEQ